MKNDAIDVNFLDHYFVGTLVGKGTLYGPAEFLNEKQKRYRLMNRQEFINYMKKVDESDGFDVDGCTGCLQGGIGPIPPGRRIFAELAAKFASSIQEDLKGGIPIEFVKHVKANYQPVEGVLYYLTFTGIDINAKEEKTYRAKVWVKPGITDTELLMFEEVAAIGRIATRKKFDAEDSGTEDEKRDEVKKEGKGRKKAKGKKRFSHRVRECSDRFDAEDSCTEDEKRDEEKKEVKGRKKVKGNKRFSHRVRERSDRFDAEDSCTEDENREKEKKEVKGKQRFSHRVRERKDCFATVGLSLSGWRILLNEVRSLNPALRYGEAKKAATKMWRSFLPNEKETYKKAAYERNLGK